jgi:hypothetical protein
MRIELTEEESADLADLLRGALGELSSEIAATDNAGYRDGLRSRRMSLEAVLAKVDTAKAAAGG